MEDSNRFSKTVRNMLQLKHTLLKFIRCVIGDGVLASFWFDAWTYHGPLISYIGEAGPRLLRVHKDARVIESSRNGQWHMPSTRAEEIQNVLISFTNIAVPNVARGSDKFMWRNAAGVFSENLSSKDTWEQLRVPSPIVHWAKVIWFSETVPRFSFFTWLGFLKRLPTRDILRRWGLNVPPESILCDSGIESHDHLSFECVFSAGIWSSFASRVWPNPPMNLHDASSWITQVRPQTQRHTTGIIKLILQATFYSIWRERNARIFIATFSHHHFRY